MSEEPANGAGRPTISELFTQLAEDAGGLARAEFALYRAEAAKRAMAVGVAAGLLLGAIVLVQAAVVALLVGLIMLIGQSTGTGWALLIVVGGALLVAALMGWLGVQRIRSMAEPEVTP
jgi:hypothetical protein